MKITLKDGSVKEYEHSMSVIDIAKDLSDHVSSLPPRRGCAQFRLTFSSLTDAASVGTDGRSDATEISETSAGADLISSLA